MTRLKWLAAPAQVPTVGWLETGQEFTLDERLASSLIEQGKAEVVKPAKPAKEV